jgi:hypothetical protein
MWGSWFYLVDPRSPYDPDIGSSLPDFDRQSETASSIFEPFPYLSGFRFTLSLGLFCALYGAAAACPAERSIH